VSIGVREVVTKAAEVGSLCMLNISSPRFVPASTNIKSGRKSGIVGRNDLINLNIDGIDIYTSV
jgi:hypothetical protein